MFLRRVTMAALATVLLVAAVGPVQAQPANGATEKSTPQATAPAKVETSKAEAKDESEEYRQSPVVKKIGGMMGMKPAQASTAFTITNLLILFAAVGYGMMKALPKFFRARSSAIQKNLMDARTATEEATARLNSVEARLSKLDEQIAAMRAQSEADSVRDEVRIKASVEDEKAKILAATEAEIQSATILARREIQKYAAELAIEQAARKLSVSAETDRLIIENFANRLGSDGSAN